MRVWPVIADAISRHGACVLVTQIAVQGSAPRDAGARMIVMPDGTFTGTIGGGTLEWHMLARAQDMAARQTGDVEFSRHALGPGLGQCCGGSVRMMFERWTGARLGEVKALAAAEQAGPFVTEANINDAVVTRTINCQRDAGSEHFHLETSGLLIEGFGDRRRQVLVFGAGHTGRALMLALAALPFDVTWIDERREAFPAAAPANVKMVASRDPAGELTAARAGAFVIVMTHSHARDQDIVHAALSDGRFGYVGVIGSATKRTRFSSRLGKAGLPQAAVDTLVCPIGIDGIKSKEPAIIAAGVAAQLLQYDELVKTGQKPVHTAHKAVKIRSAG